MGPKNAKFLQFMKQVFQPLSTLATALQGEKGVGQFETLVKKSETPTYSIIVSPHGTHLPCYVKSIATEHFTSILVPGALWVLFFYLTLVSP